MVAVSWTPAVRQMQVAIREPGDGTGWLRRSLVWLMPLRLASQGDPLFVEQRRAQALPRMSGHRLLWSTSSSPSPAWVIVQPICGAPPKKEAPAKVWVAPLEPWIWSPTLTRVRTRWATPGEVVAHPRDAVVVVHGAEQAMDRSRYRGRDAIMLGPAVIFKTTPRSLRRSERGRGGVCLAVDIAAWPTGVEDLRGPDHQAVPTRRMTSGVRTDLEVGIQGLW